MIFLAQVPLFRTCLWEVLNEYEAIKYFGINTFTSEIFKNWDTLNDSGTVVGLSVVLLVFCNGFTCNRVCVPFQNKIQLFAQYRNQCCI